MFTSRAEYRLLLREESADVRLSGYGYELGLLSESAYKNMLVKKEQIQEGIELLRNTKFTPNKEFITLLESIDEEKINDSIFAEQLVARKSFTIEKMVAIVPELDKFNDYIKEEILVEAKYSRYVDKQSQEIEKMKKYLFVEIPENFDFSKVSGLSKEIVEKLNRFNPPTLQAALQISGMTPAALEILHIYIKISLSKTKKFENDQ